MNKTKDKFELYLNDKKIHTSSSGKKIMDFIDKWKKDPKNQKNYKIEEYNRIMEFDKDSSDGGKAHLWIDFGSYSSFFKIYRNGGETITLKDIGFTN